MMIFYKVGDPDKTLSAPALTWGSDEFVVGLDELSIGDNWRVTNLGNAIALRHGPDWGDCTLTVNFQDINIGKTVVVTVTAEDRDAVGVLSHPIVTGEWREEINAAIQGVMFKYFVDSGDWTLNGNGQKGTAAAGFTEAVKAEEAFVEDSNAVFAVDVYD